MMQPIFICMDADYDAPAGNADSPPFFRVNRVFRLVRVLHLLGLF
jgi:hypothetical protein